MIDKRQDINYTSFLEELYKNIENEEDEDKKVIRAYLWLTLQITKEINNIVILNEQRDKRLLKAIKELTKEVKKLNENFEAIVKKQETIEHYVRLDSDKLSALLKDKVGAPTL